MSISSAWFDQLTEAIQAGDLATVDKMCTVENTRGFNVCYGGETSLTRAISLEQFEITFYLLNKEGIDVDSMNRWDRTALMLASCTSNVSLIDSLISAGADVQKSDLYGDTALHLSAFYDRIDVLNRLLLMGTDVDKTNHKGRTPFFVAVDNLALVSARALVKSGCDVNKSNHDQRTPLMVLAGHNMKMSFEKGIKESDIISIIEYMKSHDVDMSATDKNGDTALHFAVESRNVYLVACLLQYGCSANIRNHEGLTAFTKAILYGQYKSADIMTMFCDMNSLLSNDSLGLFRRLLLDNTERPLSDDQRVLCLKILDIVDYAMLENFRVIISERKPLNTEENEFLQTLLQFPSLQSLARGRILLAMRHTSILTIRTLPTADRLRKYLMYNCCFFDVDLLNVMKLHLSVIEGSTEMLTHSACSCNPEILEIPIDGMTILEKAVKYERFECLRLIVSQMGTLPQNLKILNMAAEAGNIQIMQFLLSRGFDPNIRSEEQEFPLLTAAKYGHFDMVELLLNYVEEIPPSDAEGRHTIHYAAASGNSKVTAFLLDRKPELVNILDSFEYTPLHVAMSRGNVYLERNIAVPALFSSALLMDGFIMKLMYSVDKRNVRTPTYKDGVCHMDVVRLLLKYGADMTCTSADGTPEAIAASYGLQNMIQAMEI